MKRGFMKSMLLSGVMLLASCLWSCSDNQDTIPDEGLSAETAVVSIVSDPNTVFATSVELKLNVAGVESYAYYIAEGEGVQEPLGEIIYRNATQEGGSGITAVSPEGEEVPVSVYGLEGGKTYTIFFAFKAGEDYVVKSQVVTTAAYSQLLTLISADKYKIKYHVSVGTDTTYRVGIVSANDFYAYLSESILTEADLLNMGGIIVKNDTTIEISDGQPIDPSNLDNGTYVIKPGSSYILLAAQCLNGDNVTCEFEGAGGFPGGGGLPGGLSTTASRSLKPDVETDNEWKSTETEGEPYISETEHVDGYVKKITIYGHVAKINFYTEAFTQIESQMTINELTMNERTAKFSFMMGKDVVQYAATILTESDYNLMVERVGERGKIGYLLSSGLMQVASEPQELTITPMDENTNYKLITIAAYDADFNTVSYDERDFGVKRSDLPAPAIEVTSVEQDDPYLVAFNLRCTSGDCTSFKYAVQDAGEWFNLFSPEQGVTNEYLIETYGSIVTDPTVIAAINSTEGFTMIFESNEDASTTFGAFLMNKDEKSSEAMVVTGQSKAAYGEVEVNPELYSSLQGTWTATYTYYQTGFSDPIETKFDMTISDSPETIDYEDWEDFKNEEDTNYTRVFNSIKKNSPELSDSEIQDQITADIKTFKDEVKSNAKKYRSNNRLVITGFQATSSSYYKYKSAWDLYSDAAYVSYDIKELFYDYGPKLFLEIAETEDGSENVYLNVNSGLKGVPPMTAWGSYTYFMMIYNNENKAYLTPSTIPVEVNEDRSIITIKGITVSMQDGSQLDYYPTPGYVSPLYNTFMFNFGGLSNIVLTRKNTTETASTPSRVSLDNDVTAAKVSPLRADGTMRRTRFPKVIKPKKQVTMAPVSLRDFMKSKINE